MALERPAAVVQELAPTRRPRRALDPRREPGGSIGAVAEPVGDVDTEAAELLYVIELLERGAASSELSSPEGELEGGPCSGSAAWP